MGFYTETIAFLTGYSVSYFICSLATLTCSAGLRYASLASLAHSVQVLAQSLCSLPGGTVAIHEYMF